MNQLEVLLLPPGRNASPLQGHLPVIHQASLTTFCYPFILLGTERHCERKMFCPRTQHFDCARSQTWTSQPAVQCCDCYKPTPHLTLIDQASVLALVLWVTSSQAWKRLTLHCKKQVSCYHTYQSLSVLFQSCSQQSSEWPKPALAQ